MSPDWQIRAAMGVMVLYFGSSFTAYAAADGDFGFVTINVWRFLLASSLLLADLARPARQRAAVPRPAAAGRWRTASA